MHLEPIHFIAQLIHERGQLSHQPKRWSSLSPEEQKHYLDRAKAQFDIFVQGEHEADRERYMTPARRATNEEAIDRLQQAGKQGFSAGEALRNYINNTNH